MSNFMVSGINGTFTYTRSQLSHYLSYVPANSINLSNAFDNFNVTPQGGTRDLERLSDAMYSEYSKQVQNQIDNQNNTQNVPWANLCAQIGVVVTGDYQTDYEAFNNALNLLSQSAIDGNAMSYFAGIRNEALKVFGANSDNQQQPPITFEVYQANFL